MSRFSSVCLVLSFAAVFLGVSPGVVAQVRDNKILRVIVTDSKGNAVSGASVSVGGNNVPVSDCDEIRAGEFDCGQFRETASVIVRAEGFADLELSAASASDGVLTARLAPAGLRAEVTVSASGEPASVADTPASLVVLDRRQIETSPAAAIDSVVRETAGFTLFRRTDSTTANPTTQGASLRGLNPSGASRAGVLFEGVPLNDPFGGWVPWSGVPKIAVGSVEVLRGGASSLYGSDPLGGIVNILPRTVSGRSGFSAEAFAGSQGTTGISSFGGISRRNFTIDGFGSFFNTDGYIPVSARDRGAADERAGSRGTVLSARFAPKVARLAPFVRLTYFDESRKNGTRLQRNETHSRRFLAGLDPFIGDPFPGTSDTAISIRIYGLLQVYDQTFSAVSSDRSTESLTRLQRVPSQNAGLSVRFSTNASTHFLLAGFEAGETRGASDETGFFSGNPAGTSGSFGKERTAAFYFQDRVKIARVVLIGRVRADHWKNLSALSATASSGGTVTLTVFPDRAESAVSPGISASAALTRHISAYFSASRSFRAPTLNELYRGFRVGNILTLANENLKAERATGIEGGVAVWFENFSFRAGVFRNVVNDAVSNVTIDPGSSPILRRRENAARIGLQGLEIDSELRSGAFRTTIGYLLSRSEYRRFPTVPELEGKTLPQSPVHQITLNLIWSAPSSITFAVRARASSSQYDDDLNLFRLRPYFRADVFASKRFESVEVFVSTENVFNTRYDVGVTPIRTVSAPVGIRAGIRWN